MSDISSITSIPRDICISFNSTNDIDKFIHLYMKEAGRDRKDIVDYLSHYVWAVPNMPGSCIVTSSSMVINHGDPGVTENVAFKRSEDNDLIAYSVMPLKKGEEIYNDYREFDYFPQFYLDFCEREQVVDVVSGIKDVLYKDWNKTNVTA